ncbi:hypothetical protein ANN_03101 [Periplaneta americana]|uniref:Uncharacterized protein n=1 Tax=Periplaneta americana TaxID=6978 RepID=A0ABQ8TY35_PERAM|nr:hypothetical protein ANN_03101 [Periplaneta americana]
MSPGSNTVSYPAFAHIGLRENPGKNLNQLQSGNQLPDERKATDAAEEVVLEKKKKKKNKKKKKKKKMCFVPPKIKEEKNILATRAKVNLPQSHACHRTAEIIRRQFPGGDELIGAVKMIFVKAPARIKAFKKICLVYLFLLLLYLLVGVPG